MDFLLFITGIFTGIFGGFLGVGGSFIMLPILLFVFQYPLTIAVGTSVTAVVFTATSGTFGHLRNKNVDLSTAKTVASTGIFGAFFGSIIFCSSVDLNYLNLILAGIFLYASLRMIYESFKGLEKNFREARGQEESKKLKLAIGFLVGIVTGLTGLGGGFLLVPAFIYIFGFDIKLAVGTSMASFLSMAAVSSAFKFYEGVVDLIAALYLGTGTLIGAQIGALIVKLIPVRVLKAIFGLTFLYISFRFILFFCNI
ncbi:MAG: sulfite exporter TauE/SafE family protein [Archaeoglobaceae archaeon]